MGSQQNVSVSVCVFDNRLPALFVGFRLSISIPMSSMYGYDAKSVSDPCITAADASFTINMELASPGGSFINILPALRFIPPWFPGAFSRRKAETARKLTDEMVSIPLEFTKARVVRNFSCIIRLFNISGFGLGSRRR